MRRNRIKNPQIKNKRFRKGWHLNETIIWKVAKRFANVIPIYTAKNLKGLNEAKIVKKSVILFWLLNITIWCKHVHRLELQKFLIFVPRIHQLG